jgi:hypothetical protein
MGWSRGGKNTTNCYQDIDVRYLSRKGHLHPGSSCTLRWSRNGNGNEVASNHAALGSIFVSPHNLKSVLSRVSKNRVTLVSSRVLLIFGGHP